MLYVSTPSSRDLTLIYSRMLDWAFRSTLVGQILERHNASQEQLNKRDELYSAFLLDTAAFLVSVYEDMKHLVYSRTYSKVGDDQTQSFLHVATQFLDTQRTTPSFYETTPRDLTRIVFSAKTVFHQIFLPQMSILERVKRAAEVVAQECDAVYYGLLCSEADRTAYRLIIRKKINEYLFAILPEELTTQSLKIFKEHAQGQDDAELRSDRPGLYSVVPWYYRTHPGTGTGTGTSVKSRQEMSLSVEPLSKNQLQVAFEFSNWNLLVKMITELYNLYCGEIGANDAHFFVLEDWFVRNVVTLLNALHQPLGHVILLGPEDVGKTTAARFAVWIGGYTYSLKEFRRPASEFQKSEFETPSFSLNLISFKSPKGLIISCQSFSNLPFHDLALAAKKAIITAGLFSFPVILLLQNSSLLPVSLLEQLNGLLASGAYNSFFEANVKEIGLEATSQGAEGEREAIGRLVASIRQAFSGGDKMPETTKQTPQQTTLDEQLSAVCEKITTLDQLFEAFRVLESGVDSENGEENVSDIGQSQDDRRHSRDGFSASFSIPQRETKAIHQRIQNRLISNLHIVLTATVPFAIDEVKYDCSLPTSSSEPTLTPQSPENFISSPTQGLSLHSCPTITLRYQESGLSSALLSRCLTLWFPSIPPSILFTNIDMESVFAKPEVSKTLPVEKGWNIDQPERQPALKVLSTVDRILEEVARVSLRPTAQTIVKNISTSCQLMTSFLTVERNIISESEGDKDTPTSLSFVDFAAYFSSYLLHSAVLIFKLALLQHHLFESQTGVFCTPTVTDYHYFTSLFSILIFNKVHSLGAELEATLGAMTRVQRVEAEIITLEKELKRHEEEIAAKEAEASAALEMMVERKEDVERSRKMTGELQQQLVQRGEEMVEKKEVIAKAIEDALPAIQAARDAVKSTYTRSPLRWIVS